ncbi:MAG: S41 family peptidase [Candidatus Pacebacteria bacterium]|nr:S41 family peptidase [Candidatus Paceibacterota bacterium]
MTNGSDFTRRESKKNPKRWLGYFLAFSFALGAFFSGLQVGQEVNSSHQTAGLFSLFASEPLGESIEPNLDEFWHVWDLLEEKFATGSSTVDVSEEEKVQGAIDGLVDSYGDPYTVYMPPADTEAFAANIAGNFSGVGMEVGLREGVITVIAPLPDTPAMNAGILAGDVVVRIDDTTTENMSIDQAVQLIRGEKGTVVTLQIYREGEMEFLNIPITRDTINIPTVKTEQIDDTFIVAIYSFNAVAEAQVKDAMKEYLNSDAETLVIDVRGNPGGYLQSAVSIASYFLPAGKVVVKEQFSDSSRDDVFRSRGRQIQLFTPNNLVVLVDKGSASASEILAGALKDHEVATVIGSQSFGKGSVQELVNLDDGSSLKVTVARWLTPNGTSISDGGLTPDILISRTAEHRIAGIDSQKDAAVRFLAGEVVESETFEDEITASSTDAGTGE